MTTTKAIQVTVCDERGRFTFTDVTDEKIVLKGSGEVTMTAEQLKEICDKMLRNSKVQKANG